MSHRAARVCIVKFRKLTKCVDIRANFIVRHVWRIIRTNIWWLKHDPIELLKTKPVEITENTSRLLKINFSNTNDRSVLK